MKIVDILPRKAVVADLQASDMEGVIEEMAALIARCSGIIDAGELARTLLEREALSPTCIGLNVSMPHAKFGGINGLIAALGRSELGVDCGAIDGQPVRLFFILISGPNSGALHLKALAEISRLLKDDEIREALMDCGSRNEMYDIISCQDNTFDWGNKEL